MLVNWRHWTRFSSILGDDVFYASNRISPTSPEFPKMFRRGCYGEFQTLSDTLGTKFLMSDPEVT